ncbi:unnamed protein product [Paramecium octaurelia]|uniref:Uncharacterized protein n=1 Tax=Paramecium octaurelia TaxID=43137 RepID=A0A8S1XER0_PAROT|nr:unnamed protein product [Paramecium octaurelia]
MTWLKFELSQYKICRRQHHLIVPVDLGREKIILVGLKIVGESKSSISISLSDRTIVGVRGISLLDLRSIALFINLLFSIFKQFISLSKCQLKYLLIYLNNRYFSIVLQQNQEFNEELIQLVIQLKEMLRFRF